MKLPRTPSLYYTMYILTVILNMVFSSVNSNLCFTYFYLSKNEGFSCFIHNSFVILSRLFVWERKSGKYANDNCTIIESQLYCHSHALLCWK